MRNGKNTWNEEGKRDIRMKDNSELSLQMQYKPAEVNSGNQCCHDTLLHYFLSSIFLNIIRNASLLQRRKWNFVTSLEGL